MNKIPIAEGRIKGNLQSLEQVYKINYMPAEIKYSDKIELAILLEKDKLTEGAYRSIRFESLPQLKSLIVSLTKAYFFFARQKKEITMDNYRFRKNKFLNDMEAAI